MSPEKKEAIEKHLCDSQLTKITWENQGRDVVFVCNSEQGKTDILTCNWAHSVSFDYKTNKDEGGYSLTWNVKFEQMANNEWKVVFDFASKGKIELMCSEISCAN